VRLTKSVQTNDFEAVQPIDEQMDAHERKRLLYVATTRARDHLVVSLHRAGGTKSNARLLTDHEAGRVAGAVPFTGSDEEVASAAPVAPAAATPLEWEAWLARLEAVRSTSREVPTISASGLEGTEPAVSLEPPEETAAGSAKGMRDVELPPWSKGRYGTAIGRAVHGVLQVVDLATGDGLEEAVSAQSMAEGVTEYAELVRSLARSALDSDVVKRAAQRPHWRESYVGMIQDDGAVLEGFVDLAYREDDGSIVVVDYKTDAIPSAAVAARTAFYAPQMAAYRQLLQSAARTSVRSRLLFVHGRGP
jgi:ATP-dependent helicase/nuclease subunit A